MGYLIDHSEKCRGKPVDDGVQGQAGSPPVWHCDTCGRKGWVSWDKSKQTVYMFSSFLDGMIK
jgi:hypothetical protein